MACECVSCMHGSGMMYASCTVVPVLSHAVKLPRRNDKLPDICPGKASTYSSFALGDLLAHLARALRSVAPLSCHKCACMYPCNVLGGYSACFVSGYSPPSNLSRALVCWSRGIAGCCLSVRTSAVVVEGVSFMVSVCLPYSTL